MTQISLFPPDPVKPPLKNTCTITRLPGELEQFIRSAVNRPLPEIKGIPNTRLYLYAWVAEYLVGDSHEALNRINDIYIASLKQ